MLRSRFGAFDCEHCHPFHNLLSQNILRQLVWAAFPAISASLAAVVRRSNLFLTCL